MLPVHLFEEFVFFCGGFELALDPFGRFAEHQ